MIARIAAALEENLKMLNDLLEKYDAKSDGFYVETSLGDQFHFRSITSKLELDALISEATAFAASVQNALTGEPFYAFRMLSTESLLHVFFAREMFTGLKLKDSELMSPVDAGLVSQLDWLMLAEKAWKLFDVIGKGIVQHSSEQASLYDKNLIERAKKNLKQVDMTQENSSFQSQFGDAIPENLDQKV